MKAKSGKKTSSKVQTKKTVSIKKTSKTSGKKSLKKLQDGGDIPYPKGNLDGQDSAAFRMGYGKSQPDDGYTGIASNRYNALGEAARAKKEAADRVKNSLGFKIGSYKKKTN